MTTSSVLSVSQLNRQIRQWLEQDIGIVSVEGELSNVSKPASGHYYFTLKDETAQIRCVYFKNRHTALSQTLQNGQQVLTHGKLSLYEARGDYQLIVEALSDAGLGDLFRQFELLKTKLQALGLFDSACKKPLPRFPECIGIVTSATAAALQDILTTLARRYPSAHVYVYTSEVQGKQAALQLIQAITSANRHKKADVLILARGGGSIEDLWAFNDEKLAFAIRASQIPIVSGIGHETDFTIADFVADLRAATPTAAAEAVTPDSAQLLHRLDVIHAQLIRAITKLIQHKQVHLSHHVQKITSPKQLIHSHWQTLDYLEHRLLKACHQTIRHKQQGLHLLTTRLAANNPSDLLKFAKTRLDTLESNLTKLMHIKLDTLKHHLSNVLSTLHVVSPLATLERGYSITTHHNKVILSSQQVRIGDILNVRLAEGSLACEIKSKETYDAA